MKIWHRVLAFGIFLTVSIVGIKTLTRLYNSIVLSITFKKCEQLSICKHAERNFSGGLGYWKDIYKTYHIIAYLKYKEGKIDDARSALKSALYYHPFYPNGYKMLGFLIGQDTPIGKACYDVYRTIMKEGVKPDKNVMNMCLSANM